MTKTTPMALVLAVLMNFPSLGLAGNGIVALQTADPACPDDSSDIYVDCGNGTVTDNRTGLVWLKDASCYPITIPLFWFEAMDAVDGLSDLPPTSAAASDDCGLSDNSSPGEWRLPSLAEWEAMIADAVTLGCVGASLAPAITNDRGTNCWVEGVGVNSFVGVFRDEYWSSSTVASLPVFAWLVNLFDGTAQNFAKGDHQAHVWPVRGGQ